MVYIFNFQWVGSIDLTRNENANANVVVERDATILEQVKQSHNGYLYIYYNKLKTVNLKYLLYD